MKKTALIVLSCLLLAGCTASSVQDENTSTPSACSEEGFGCTAETKPSTADFTAVSFDDAIAMFENGESGILYFGFPDCPWCKEIVPILAKEAKEQNTDVYYVQTRDDEHNLLYTDEQKEKIIPYLQDYMSENEDGVLTLYVPLVAAVKDGKAVAGHVGTVDGHDAHEREMTEEETEQAKQAIAEVVAASLQ